MAALALTSSWIYPISLIPPSTPSLPLPSTPYTPPFPFPPLPTPLLHPSLSSLHYEIFRSNPGGSLGFQEGHSAGGRPRGGQLVYGGYCQFPHKTWVAPHYSWVLLDVTVPPQEAVSTSGRPHQLPLYPWHTLLFIFISRPYRQLQESRYVQDTGLDKSGREVSGLIVIRCTFHHGIIVLLAHVTITNLWLWWPWCSFTKGICTVYGLMGWDVHGRLGAHSPLPYLASSPHLAVTLQFLSSLHLAVTL